MDSLDKYCSIDNDVDSIKFAVIKSLESDKEELINDHGQFIKKVIYDIDRICVTTIYLEKLADSVKIKEKKLDESVYLIEKTIKEYQKDVNLLKEKFLESEIEKYRKMIGYSRIFEKGSILYIDEKIKDSNVTSQMLELINKKSDGERLKIEVARLSRMYLN